MIFSVVTFVVQPSPLSISRTFSPSQTKTLYLLKISPQSSSPKLLITTVLLCLYWTILDASYNWQYTVFAPLVSGLFHLTWCLQKFTHVSGWERISFPFKGWIIFHSVDVTRFVFSVICGSNEAADFLEVDEGFSILLHSLFHHPLQRTQILEIRTTKWKSHKLEWVWRGCPLD